MCITAHVDVGVAVKRKVHEARQRLQDRLGQRQELATGMAPASPRAGAPLSARRPFPPFLPRASEAGGGSLACLRSYLEDVLSVELLFALHPRQQFWERQRQREDASQRPSLIRPGPHVA